MNAVGLDGSKLDVVLMQLVKLVRNGEIVRMSKRTGKAIQLADLLDEVPVDAARFLFNMQGSQFPKWRSIWIWRFSRMRRIQSITFNMLTPGFAVF